MRYCVSEVMNVSANQSPRVFRADGGLALLSEAAPAWAQPAGIISVRQTADTKRFAEEPALKWQPAEGSSADGIVLDPSRTYQEMLEIKDQGPIKKLIRLAQHRTAERVSPEILVSRCPLVRCFK
jgi:hypothetical protein